ncbi:MAG: hypothetical protein ACON4W_06370 [Parvibaculales bacterium]
MKDSLQNIYDRLYAHRLKSVLLVLVLVLVLSLNSLPGLLVSTATRLDEGVGYDSVVAALGAAGAYVEEQTEPGSVDRATGYRYALRRIEMLNNLFLADHGPQAPIISRCPSRLCKYGFDNPDTTYNMVYPLSGRYAYKVAGNRGTVAYITFQVMNIGPGGFNAGGTLESGGLVLDENGDFEILLAAENPDNHPNFMPIMADGGAQLLIRQLNTDWLTSVEASLRVEVLSPTPDTPEYPRIFDMEMMSKRGLGYGMVVRNQMQIWRDVIANAPVNRLETGAKRSGNEDGGFPTNFTATMQYQVDEDEAVILEIPQLDVVYSNIQLGNLWGESLDYGSRLVSYNNAQAHLDADGVYRYVIAMTDPGVPNWLDASGHPRGGVFTRWQSPDGPVPKTSVKRVPLSELRDHLPEGHPVMKPKSRVAQLRARRAAYNRRLNPTDMR